MLLRRFRRNHRGSAAVEFALVAPVFFALLFAIIETATMFFASQVLETITQDSARMILTGQAQNCVLHPGAVSSLCLQPDPGAVRLQQALRRRRELATESTFPLTLSTQIDASGNFINNMQYNPGGPGSIVVVRLFYQWPLFVTGLGYNISNLAGNKRLLVATAAFQNEPY